MVPDLDLDRDLDPNRYHVHRAEVRPGVSLAYVREGVGGVPLLLIHGFPETKRIWWRNIGPLADAGFEVIVADLRRYGDSPMPDDGFADTAAYSRDLHALVCDILGHDSCVAAAGDLGGVVMYDLGLRFPGLVTRQCFFNSVPPPAGGDAGFADHPVATADYFIRQGTDADGLAAELDTPQRRVAYIADFYGHRLWAGPNSFDAASISFHAEPFADATTFRTSIAAYEPAFRSRPISERALFKQPNDIPTLVLYGPEDHVIPAGFPHACAGAFSRCIGPFVVPGAGHFLQWERAELFNRALEGFLLR